MDKMKRYSRALLFIGALALIPLGAMSTHNEPVAKMNTAGASFSVGYGGGYGYGHRWRGGGWNRGYYARPYWGYYNRPYRGYYGYPYYGNGVVLVI